MEKQRIATKIIVATHKKYPMPSDDIYLPVHVGKEGKESLDYIGDNTRDNISNKNSTYCELTGLYWGWKNLDCDYIGLVHYRRHFTNNKMFCKKSRDKMNQLLTSKEINKLIPKYKIIVPKKRRYYIETLYDHYKHTHYAEHLDITRNIIKEKYPEYLKYLDKVYSSKSGYMFNMYIMEKKLSDEYCEWLFNILFELETRVKISELSQFQGRFLGRVSEIIFNCWLMYYVKEKQVTIKEIGYIHMEKINWIKKGKAFLKAKYFNEKYDSSF